MVWLLIAKAHALKAFILPYLNYRLHTLAASTHEKEIRSCVIQYIWSILPEYIATNCCTNYHARVSKRKAKGAAKCWSDTLSTCLPRPWLKTGMRTGHEDAAAWKQTYFCHSIFFTAAVNKCQDGRNVQFTQDSESDFHSKVTFVMLRRALKKPPGLQ